MHHTDKWVCTDGDENQLHQRKLVITEFIMQSAAAVPWTFCTCNHYHDRFIFIEISPFGVVLLIQVRIAAQLLKLVHFCQ